MLDIQCTQSGNAGLAGSGPVVLKMDESLGLSRPLLQAGCTYMLPPREEIRRIGEITFYSASSSSWDFWNEQDPREDTFKDPPSRPLGPSSPCPGSSRDELKQYLNVGAA